MKTKLLIFAIVFVLIVGWYWLTPASGEDEACLRTLVPTMQPQDLNGLHWCFDLSSCGGSDHVCMVDSEAARFFPWLMSTPSPVAYPWPVTVVEQAPYPAPYDDPDDEQPVVQDDAWVIVTRHGRGKP